MTEAVKIGDREFRVGAWYAAKLPGRQHKRKFELYNPSMYRTSDGMNRPGGTVFYWRRGLDLRQCSAVAWINWAGDEVLP